MTTSICPVCGYVHEGSLETLAPGWNCPACGCAGDRFKPPDAGRPRRLPPFPRRPAVYLCLACGYAYDPAQGDPSQGDSSQDVPPETPFADLPADWRCPTCGAPKQRFAREV
jgi:rubredoxin